MFLLCITEYEVMKSFFNYRQAILNVVVHKTKPPMLVATVLNK